MESYQQLKVWQKSIALVTDIYKTTKNFPADERYGLVTQMQRSAVSVPSNIAEGWGRGNTIEYMRFLKIARGSLLELETQIIIANNLEYLQPKVFQILTQQTKEVGRMLNGLITSLANKTGGRG